VALRARLGHLFGEDAAEATRLIYGGSVTGGNAADLAAVPECDGLFVGRHAWTPSGLTEIAAIVADLARKVSQWNKEHAS
jgi:triosephosphate isomerase